LGQVSLQWQVSGFGDFSGNAGETDMLMQATSGPNAGAFEVYDISNNAITSAASMGAVGLEWTVAGFGDFSCNAGETDMLLRGFEWTVAGFGDFSGNVNESDMLMRNSNTGAFEVYDISHNAITSAGSMGSVGLDWQVGGIAADPPAGSSAASTAWLVQAMASFAASAAVNSTPSAVLGGGDTPQQTLLTVAH